MFFDDIGVCARFSLVCRMFSAIVERMFASLAALKERRSALDAAEAAWLADVAEYHHSGDWNTEHYLNAASAIADACRIDTGVAQTYVTLARKLEKLPAVAVADAYAAGDISGRHAAVIAGAHTRARADQLSCIDNRLAELAKNSNPPNSAPSYAATPTRSTATAARKARKNSSPGADTTRRAASRTCSTSTASSTPNPPTSSNGPSTPNSTETNAPATTAPSANAAPTPSPTCSANPSNAATSATPTG